MSESLFNNVAGFIKGDPIQMLFCEYYEIFKNIYFEELLRTATSEPTLRDLERSPLICIKTSKATE